MSRTRSITGPRTEVIKVIVSEDEKATAEEKAAAEGLTVSAFLRRYIKLAPGPQVPTAEQRT